MICKAMEIFETTRLDDSGWYAQLYQLQFSRQHES